MKTYKLIAAGLLTICFNFMLWHGEVFSHNPSTSSEFLNLQQSEVRPDTTGKHRLVQLAGERGWVRVIVTYNMEHTPERYLSGGHRYAQRQEIEQMYDALVDELQNKSLNVRIGRKIETYPVIGLTVDEDALRYLYKSNFVKRVEKERGGQR